MNKQSFATLLTRRLIERKEKAVGIRFPNKLVGIKLYIIGLSQK
jgi:hypothetical protein